MIRRYTLTPEELESCYRIGRARNTQQEANRVTNRRMASGLTNEQAHIIGAKGEWIFCREQLERRQLPPVHRHGDGGEFDYVVGAYRIEVKTTHHAGNGNFIIPQRKNLKATHGVLFETPSIASLDVALVGWLTRAEFTLWEEAIDWNQGLTRIVRRWRLHDIDDLFPPEPTPEPEAPPAPAVVQAALL